jgi:hypothetical protein
LKEGGALRAPRLLRFRVLRCNGIEQHAGEYFHVERIRTRGGNELAELFDPARLQATRLVLQRLQFRVV